MIDRRTLLGAMAAFPLFGAGACAASPQGPASAGGRGPSAAGLRERLIPGANKQVPVIGIGTARRFQGASSEEQLAPLRAAISRFVELGGRLIDTAPAYGDAEQVVGRLVAELGVRDRLFLATKVGAGSPEEGRAQIAQSFSNLRTDVIDLIAVHNLRDVTNQLATLREMKAAGAVPASAAEHAELEAMMRRERVDVIQIDYALDNRGAGERILPLAQEQGLAVMINLPFGRGRLLQATQGRPLPDWAAEIGATSWPQVFLKYIVSHPARPIAIPGMAQARYVDDNMGAARGPMPDAALRRRMEAYIDAL
jgi:aryl-alcohol dehydrogenase-like predicted oxidoreductase